MGSFRLDQNFINKIEKQCQEKAKNLALEQAQNIKAKAEELYKYAIEKSTPVVEKAADEVRKQALKVVKEIIIMIYLQKLLT